MSTIKVDTIQDTSGNEQFTAKAWVNFNGTGTVAIRDSGNVSSITDNGTGDYSPSFTSSMADASYVVSGTCSRQDGYNDGNNLFGISRTATPLSAGSCRVNAVGGSSTLVDMSTVTTAIFK